MAKKKKSTKKNPKKNIRTPIDPLRLAVLGLTGYPTVKTVQEYRRLTYDIRESTSNLIEYFGYDQIKDETLKHTPDTEKYFEQVALKYSDEEDVPTKTFLLDTLLAGATAVEWFDNPIGYRLDAKTAEYATWDFRVNKPLVSVRDTLDQLPPLPIYIEIEGNDKYSGIFISEAPLEYERSGSDDTLINKILFQFLVDNNSMGMSGTFAITSDFVETQYLYSRTIKVMQEAFLYFTFIGYICKLQNEYDLLLTTEEDYGNNYIMYTVKAPSTLLEKTSNPDLEFNLSLGLLPYNGCVNLKHLKDDFNNMYLDLAIFYNNKEETEDIITQGVSSLFAPPLMDLYKMQFIYDWEQNPFVIVYSSDLLERVYTYYLEHPVYFPSDTLAFNYLPRNSFLMVNEDTNQMTLFGILNVNGDIVNIPRDIDKLDEFRDAVFLTDHAVITDNKEPLVLRDYSGITFALFHFDTQNYIGCTLAKPQEILDESYELRMFGEEDDEELVDLVDENDEPDHSRTSNWSTNLYIKKIYLLLHVYVRLRQGDLNTIESMFGHDYIVDFDKVVHTFTTDTKDYPKEFYDKYGVDKSKGIQAVVNSEKYLKESTDYLHDLFDKRKKSQRSKEASNISNTSTTSNLDPASNSIAIRFSEGMLDKFIEYWKFVETTGADMYNK